MTRIKIRVIVFAQFSIISRTRRTNSNWLTELCSFCDTRKNIDVIQTKCTDLPFIPVYTFKRLIMIVE